MSTPTREEFDALAERVTNLEAAIGVALQALEEPEEPEEQNHSREGHEAFRARCRARQGDGR